MIKLNRCCQTIRPQLIRNSDFRCDFGSLTFGERWIGDQGQNCSCAHRLSDLRFQLAGASLDAPQDATLERPQPLHLMRVLQNKRPKLDLRSDLQASAQRRCSTTTPTIPPRRFAITPSRSCSLRWSPPSFVNNCCNVTPVPETAPPLPDPPSFCTLAPHPPPPAPETR